jgi:hypothetical protein
MDKEKIDSRLEKYLIELIDHFDLDAQKIAENLINNINASINGMVISFDEEMEFRKELGCKIISEVLDKL